MKFKVGDRVSAVVTNHFRCGVHVMELVGKVVCFSEFIDGEPNVGIDFGFNHPMFNDLDGRLASDTGRYIRYHDIKEGK